ncbi:MAG TPA: aldo/keto reductase, partial [Gammaproteobacteria bacterium]|nr:aldo/keto reductase [Gammaproteobacteria bacterium]
MSRSRRRFLATTCATALGLLIQPLRLQAAALPAITKAIPSSGERLPVVGLGTSRTLDVAPDAESVAKLLPVMQAFFAHGGGVIDTSPMYGHAEAMLGELLQAVPHDRDRLFAATKVWTWGKDEGVQQMQESMQLMGIERFDLIQIHNLRDWQAHHATLQDWKRAGKVRYLGITTSHGRDHEELELALETVPFDFVQLSYNIIDREAEQRLLPLAQERGIAVLANRPFRRGELFQSVRGKALPDWAAEFDCTSWAQFFLKFVVSYPTVTCAIPASSKVKHLIDNMGAGTGRLPDAAMRKRMVELI